MDNGFSIDERIKTYVGIVHEMGKRTLLPHGQQKI